MGIIHELPAEPPGYQDYDWADDQEQWQADPEFGPDVPPTAKKGGPASTPPWYGRVLTVVSVAVLCVSPVWLVARGVEVSSPTSLDAPVKAAGVGRVYGRRCNECGLFVKRGETLCRKHKAALEGR